MSGLISKCTTLKAGKLSRVVEIENYNIKLNPRERMFVVVVNADPLAIAPGQPEPTGRLTGVMRTFLLDPFWGSL